jgi:hypothetical protein
VVQGERAALPLQGKVAGCVCRAWCPSLLLSRWQGMVVWVWVLTGFYEVEGRESERKNIFKKSSSSLTLHAQGRRRTIWFFFFLKKRKRNLKEPKNRL